MICVPDARPHVHFIVRETQYEDTRFASFSTESKKYYSTEYCVNICKYIYIIYTRERESILFFFDMCAWRTPTRMIHFIVRETQYEGARFA